MILVADASALIALATCDSLMLLEGIFGNVFVPDAVYAEVTELDKPQSTRLRGYLQGKVREVDMKNFVYLDADYLLIDDQRGRKVAKINNIKTIGSMGVLLQAKRVGLIPCVAPLLEKIAASPVFMSESLIGIVLELANELPNPD